MTRENESGGREPVGRAARERLREQLAHEARQLANDDGDSAVIADVQAFLAKLREEVNTS